MKGIRVQKMQVSATGHITAIEPPAFEFIKCDTLIIAIGQGPNPVLTSRWPELKTNRGLIEVDDRQATNIEGVYAGGDIATGAATVIRACGAGRVAGININKYLKDKFKGINSPHYRQLLTDYNKEIANAGKEHEIAESETITSDDNPEARTV